MLDLFVLKSLQCHQMTFLQVLEDFDIPEVVRDIFVSIPVEEFRMDISSTEIRKRSGM